MSIPGLGQIPVQPPPSATRTITLQPCWEWRFEAPFVRNASLTSTNPSSTASGPATSANPNAPPTRLTVRLLSGTAERDGTELATGTPYTFVGQKSKILTWQGCQLEVSGPCEDYVAEMTPDENPGVQYLNLHFYLQKLRNAAGQPGGRGVGPRVMVCGAPMSGKTSVVKSLLALATRSGMGCVGVGLDPKDGMLALPGTVGAAVFRGLMDVETGGISVGDTPSSGPAAVPSKVPVVYLYGRRKVEEESGAWREVCKKLAGAVKGRMTTDEGTRRAGVVVDVPALAKGGVDLLAGIAQDFDINTVVVLGSARLNAELQRKLAGTKTSLGEDISVVALDRSEGVVEMDEVFLQQVRESAIKEYFFGSVKRTLSPATQQVDFAAVSIYRIPEVSEYLADEEVLEKIEPVPEMAHWTLAVMNASVKDSVDTIRWATVMGFVYVADVEPEKRRLKILSPVSGRLGDRPLVWAHWPEPYINLLG